MALFYAIFINISDKEVEVEHRALPLLPLLPLLLYYARMAGSEVGGEFASGFLVFPT